VPTDKESTLFSFMNPLGLDIWLVVVASFSIASFTLYALARLSPYEWRNPRPWKRRQQHQQPLVNKFNVSNSVWFITGTLLRQGSGVSPEVSAPPKACASFLDVFCVPLVHVAVLLLFLHAR